jgi:hypothetical protein
MGEDEVRLIEEGGQTSECEENVLPSGGATGEDEGDVHLPNVEVIWTERGDADDVFRLVEDMRAGRYTVTDATGTYHADDRVYTREPKRFCCFTYRPYPHGKTVREVREKWNLWEHKIRPVIYWSLLIVGCISVVLELEERLFSGLTFPYKLLYGILLALVIFGLGLIQEKIEAWVRRRNPNAVPRRTGTISEAIWQSERPDLLHM